MSERSGKLTRQGEDLVKNWLDAQRRVASAKQLLANAYEIEREAHQALGEWILPVDANSGEKIAVWFGDSLIQSEVLAIDEGKRLFEVTIRQRGRTVDELSIP